MTSTHDTRRRCSTAAAVVVTLAVMFAPALTPAALAYDAKASRPSDAVRVVLPDWDRLDGGINPFDGNLIPRRAMESPQELWGVDLVGALYAGGCYLQIFACTGAIGGAWAAYGIARATFAAAEHLHVPPNPCTPGEFCGEAD